MAETRFGPYIVHELLGTGGMATVHLAETQSAGGFRKRVALKRLLPHLTEDAETVESFAREARLASHLRHQHIAQTFDLGVIERTYYIAMELVPGPTLRQVMHQCETAAGAIPIEHTLEIAMQVAGALDYAHNLADDSGKPLGIVHRDVSPANVIVSGAGIVKLIDFGLAKVASSRATQVGILKGKLSYMAPEYTLGRLDHRADLFALGVIVHEMLTGRALFDAPTDHEAIDLLREMPIQPPSRWNPRVPAEVDDIVMTALQRDPDKRWQTAAALGAALQNVVRDQNLVTTRAKLAAWVEWAFTRETLGDVSGLTAVIADLGDTSDPRGRRPAGITPTPTPTPELATIARTLESTATSELPTIARTLEPEPPTTALPTRLERLRPRRRAITDARTNPVPVVARPPRQIVRGVLVALLLGAGAAAAAYFALPYLAALF